jgi:hypothetical protein
VLTVVVDVPMQISAEPSKCNLRSVVGFEMRELIRTMIRFAEWTTKARDTYTICKTEDPSGRQVQFELESSSVVRRNYFTGREMTNVSIITQCQYARLIRSPLVEFQSICLLDVISKGKGRGIAGANTYHVTRS